GSVGGPWRSHDSGSRPIGSEASGSLISAISFQNAGFPEKTGFQFFRKFDIIFAFISYSSKK
ncbi:MAG: hypothetical protein ACO4AU_00515, partial [bacterium]